MSKTNSYSILIVSILVLAFSTDGLAADEDKTPPTFLAKIIKFLKPTVRQSIYDKNLLEKPASFQLIQSYGSSPQDSKSVDGGFTFNIVSTDKWVFAPTIEYHRQTAITKPQNNLQIGIMALHTMGDVTEALAVLFVQGSLKYKSDQYTTGKGLFAKLEISPISPGLHIGVLKGPNFIKFGFQPTIGIQYESSNNVLSSAAAGTVLRLNGNLEIGLFPLADILKNTLEVTFRASYWHNLERTRGYLLYAPKEQSFLRISLTQYLDIARHLGIGLDYLSGENPDIGFLKQRVLTFGLRILY